MAHPSPSPRLAPTACDLLVVGGGAAGLVAAQTARRLGAKVALIDRASLGGECLHTGCVPSKALLHAAGRARPARPPTAAAPPSGTQALKAARRAVEAVAPHDSAERYRALGVDVHFGEARFLGPHTVEAGNRIFRARRIILATGSRPLRPHWPGLDGVPWVDTDTLWSRTSLPPRLTIVGGGASGCELAQGLARLGHDVCLLEARARLLPEEEEETARVLEAALREDGVRVQTGTRVEALETTAEGVRITTSITGGGPSFWATDLLILTLGRVPGPEPAGLDLLGIEKDPRGYVRTDPCLRTSLTHVYACGDITGPPQSTAVAGRQGWYAAVNALLGPWVRLRWTRAPLVRAVYTDPELAVVEHAVPRPVTRWLRIDLAEVDRALLEGRTEGFLRLGLDRRGRLSRAVLVSPAAGELASELALTMGMGWTPRRLLTTARAYPVYGEILARAAGRLLDERWECSLTARVGRGLVALARLRPLPHERHDP